MTAPSILPSRCMLSLIMILILAGACTRLPSTPTAATSTPVTNILTQTPISTPGAALSTPRVAASPTLAISSSLPPTLPALSGRFVFADAGNLYIVNAGCAKEAGACDRESIRLTNVPDDFFVEAGGGITASPDGGKIAFSYRKFDTPTTGETKGLSEREMGDIYVLDIAECLAIKDGCPPERFVRLTNDSGDDYAPAWSPQGDRIVFTRQTLGPYSYGGPWLYEMAVDGSHQQLMLSEVQQFTMGPNFASWSPDGKKLAMVGSDEMRSTAIFVLDLSDFRLQQITHLPSNDESGDELELLRPRWSPRDDRIIFEATPATNPIGYIVNTDGTGLARLPLNNAPAAFAWSPDGTKMIYTGSCEPHKKCLFMANADGSHLQQLTQRGLPTATLWIP